MTRIITVGFKGEERNIADLLKLPQPSMTDASYRFLSMPIIEDRYIIEL